MHEIRIHSRGGQGGLTAGRLLAVAAFHDGKHSQAFPMFGVERWGAPVVSFVRIDRKPIMVRSQIYEPDIVLVLDSSLLSSVEVTKGLNKQGTLIINSNKTAKELDISGDFKVYAVNATETALEIFKRPVINTPMLGAFSKISGLVSIKSLKKAVDEVLLDSKGQSTADLNKRAIEEACKGIK